MKIFTIESGNVTEGIRVDSFTLKGAGITIPAILVGEEGRGRRLGVLPVQLLPSSYKEWQEEGTVSIHSAKVGETRAGKPKLLETSGITDAEKCICVFRTKIGFRGGNSHTGDRDGGTEKTIGAQNTLRFTHSQGRSCAKAKSHRVQPGEWEVVNS